MIKKENTEFHIVNWRMKVTVKAKEKKE